ncbi:MAG: site-2 protease family protein [Rhodanobacteraceae bacterium]|nr:site-2 protease family protein [Rhodanobacteraceae bacterium]
MFDLVALAFAIFLLLQLQRVRTLLSLVFGPQRKRRIVAPRIPEAFADLHAQAETELRALGFEGPIWYLLDSPDGGLLAQPVAAWRQPEQGDVLWLYAPPTPTFANRLVSVFTRRLSDGRYCISQAFDCYSEILADEQVLAQTIGGADFAAQWQRHGEFCARHGSADPTATSDAALDQLASDLQDRRLASLVQRGKVYRDSKGLLRPTLAFAWQIYRALWRQPKPPVSQESVPPARLAWMAQVAQRQTLCPVPRRVQAGLFAFSVALFLGIGGWFWGLQFAATLFVVVAIHEFGHYLAMRLSGYRNVQMLALPLVGGVTMGYEAKPDAARRAWMSLMGPLPGIVIGWVLLAWWWLSGTNDNSLWSLLNGMNGNGLLFQAALMFLFINYLNVLPIPPLDGAHVVQELLPVGSARLSAVFMAVAALSGALLAFWLGFKLLALIALLQLPLVRNRWQLGAVLRLLRGDPQVDASQPAMLRQRRVFEVFDRVAGTSAQATTRLALGGEAMRSLDVRPMRWLQRLLIGGTYALLLAGPIFAGIVAMSFMPLFGTAMDAAESSDKYRQRYERFETEVARLGTAELLRGILANDAKTRGQAAPALAAPVADATVAAAQARLGLSLPPDLLALYRTADGVKSLGLLPLAQVRPLAQMPELDVSRYAVEGRIEVFASDGTLTSEAPPQEIVLKLEQIQYFLLIGADAEFEVVTLYDAAEQPLSAGLRVYSFRLEGGADALPGLSSWLRQRWVHSSLSADLQSRIDTAREREAALLADWPAARLLGEFERPGLLARAIAPQTAWPDPADEADIAGIAVRFGSPVPDELAAVYRQHDGVPAVFLLPLARWQPVPALTAEIVAQLREASAQPPLAFDAAELDSCIVIGGVHIDRAGADELAPAGLVHANLLWCPRASADRRYVDLTHQRTWRDYTDALRRLVAEQRASRVVTE